MDEYENYRAIELWAQGVGNVVAGMSEPGSDDRPQYALADGSRGNFAGLDHDHHEFIPFDENRMLSDDLLYLYEEQAHPFYTRRNSELAPGHEQYVQHESPENPEVGDIWYQLVI